MKRNPYHPPASALVQNPASNAGSDKTLFYGFLVTSAVYLILRAIYIWHFMNNRTSYGFQWNHEWDIELYRNLATAMISLAFGSYFFSKVTSSMQRMAQNWIINTIFSVILWTLGYQAVNYLGALLFPTSDGPLSWIQKFDWVGILIRCVDDSLVILLFCIIPVYFPGRLLARSLQKWHQSNA